MLICSDGHVSAENAIRFIARAAAACSAEVTLLGVIEHPDDEAGLGEALQRGARILRDAGVRVEVDTGRGQPLDQIKQRTVAESFDLVVVGAERKTSRPFALSTKAYHIIKRIEPPVLVALGKRLELSRILVCASGLLFPDRTIELTAAIARGAGATVTLVHVLAEPPLIYSDLLEREISGVDKLLASNFSLAKNLRQEKAAFEKEDVAVEVKLRSGEVARELLKEAHSRDYGLIVTGSSLTGGPIQSYMMGNVTAAILDGADCPVLVVRNGPRSKSRNWIIEVLRRLFGTSR